MASKTYNGHRNWSQWNVALWLANDEGLYSLARSCLRHYRTKDEAARAIVAEIGTMTPDGARYSFSAVRAAIAGEF